MELITSSMQSGNSDRIEQCDLFLPHEFPNADDTNANAK
jgi:hypothetical protein